MTEQIVDLLIRVFHYYHRSRKKSFLVYRKGKRQLLTKVLCCLLLIPCGICGLFRIWKTFQIYSAGSLPALISTFRSFVHFPLFVLFFSRVDISQYGRFFPESVIVLENKAICYPARAESARAVTGRRCPHSGVGEDFFCVSAVFFYKNGSNSETKCRKIDPKVDPVGLQTGLMQFGVVWPKKCF